MTSKIYYCQKKPTMVFASHVLFENLKIMKKIPVTNFNLLNIVQRYHMHRGKVFEYFANSVIMSG